MRPITFAVFVAVAGLISACASSTTQQAAVAPEERLARIDDLSQRAVRQPVHPFRKPVRDARQRALQELEEECGLLLAELSTQSPPAALTGRPTASSTAYLQALQTTVREMGQAAHEGDLPAVEQARLRMRSLN